RVRWLPYGRTPPPLSGSSPPPETDSTPTVIRFSPGWKRPPRLRTPQFANRVASLGRTSHNGGLHFPNSVLGDSESWRLCIWLGCVGRAPRPWWPHSLLS